MHFISQVPLPKSSVKLTYKEIQILLQSIIRSLLHMALSSRKTRIIRSQAGLIKYHPNGLHQQKIGKDISSKFQSEIRKSLPQSTFLKMYINSLDMDIAWIFPPDESSETSIEMMRVLAQEYHINLVQYYDWMYCHEQILLVDSESFIDMFNHTLSKDTITQRINAGHQYSQLAMAYQMSCMARENYQVHGASPSWGLYSLPDHHNISYNPSDPQSLNSINQYFFPLKEKPAPLLMVMNPLNTDWQNYMANQYSKAVSTLDFDGIPIDQMGNFRGDATYYSDNGDTVDNEPVRHIYLNGNDAGYIHFPVISDWETLKESHVTIHVTPGLHRLVLYTENADNGYINLDQMEIQ